MTDWIQPPGGTIVDLLEERGWTHVELAQALDCSTQFVEDLLFGHVPISLEIAERLSSVFGSTPEFWLKLESNYRDLKLEFLSIDWVD